MLPTFGALKLNLTRNGDEIMSAENTESRCPNCGDLMDPDYDDGFTCDDCARCQPMGVWVSSWPKISER